jgi:hypothetical protein
MFLLQLVADSLCSSRCRRINKTCVPRERVRSRNGKIMNSMKAAQASQLVSKINGLISLLKSVSESSPMTEPPNSAGLDLSGSNGNRSSNLYSLIEAVTRKISAGSLPLLQHSYLSQDSSNPPPRSGSSPCVDSHSSLWSRTVLTPAPELGSVDTAISPSFSGFQPSLKEAEEYLQIFRTQLLTYLPFIDIQSCTSA